MNIVIKMVEITYHQHHKIEENDPLTITCSQSPIITLSGRILCPIYMVFEMPVFI